MRSILLLFCLLLITSTAHAQIITGKVVNVADGDTVTVLDSRSTGNTRYDSTASILPKKGKPMATQQRNTLLVLSQGNTLRSKFTMLTGTGEQWVSSWWMDATSTVSLFRLVTLGSTGSIAKHRPVVTGSNLNERLGYR